MNTSRRDQRPMLVTWGHTALIFVAGQLWAALFALIILSAIIVTKAIWQPDWALARYDALVLIALVAQILMLVFRLETLDEAKVILLFHITGTVMELFKVNIGSWHYPEPGLIKLLGVPLFTGFMYASVGSYIARSIRLFGIVLAPFPPYPLVTALALAIYVNFFAHHYLPDIRIALYVATLLVFFRTRLWLQTRAGQRSLPLPMAALIVAGLLWVAENIGTFTGTWAYAGQLRWEAVSFRLIGSWYLLFYVAFATVLIVFRDACRPGPWLRSSRASEPAPEARPPATAD
ncbi:DUF817 domain-containing protein [Pseudooceanicola sp.]|uniref:DUF817 domain-containing protein n=1 Tax=Pseudooceanicola sp. TaxID=1914328 RepID=UPI0026383666|nr:DUF817 domain-containing protein [Pseudooceanicola sp.]MDF1854516.1 DUF817 domain-containing protein [Pseudooceanicola sp.]